MATVTLAFHIPSKEPHMRQVAIAMILPFLISSAFAASAPLAPGKPAGVKQAQDQEISTPLLVMGAAAVGIGIALAVSGDSNSPAPGPTTPTVTTTGTGP